MTVTVTFCDFPVSRSFLLFLKEEWCSSFPPKLTASDGTTNYIRCDQLLMAFTLEWSVVPFFFVCCVCRVLVWIFGHQSWLTVRLLSLSSCTLSLSCFLSPSVFPSVHSFLPILYPCYFLPLTSLPSPSATSHSVQCSFLLLSFSVDAVIILLSFASFVNSLSLRWPLTNTYVDIGKEKKSYKELLIGNVFAFSLTHTDLIVRFDLSLTFSFIQVSNDPRSLSISSQLNPRSLTSKYGVSAKDLSRLSKWTDGRSLALYSIYFSGWW